MSKTFFASAVIGVSVLLAPLEILANEQIPYGSRAGMSLTVISKSGIGTSHAVIEVRHEPANAKEFCVLYEMDNSMDCVRRTMKEVKVADRVVADCKAGTWTDPYGVSFAYEGPDSGSANFMADYIVRRIDSGEILDGTMASGYPIVMSIFEQLCPDVIN